MIELNNPYCKTPKMSAAMAWEELARFAARACIEMDDRAHPDYEPSDDEPEDSADQHPDGESEPHNYSGLLKALRYSHMTVDEHGKLEINLALAIDRGSDCKAGPLETIVFHPPHWHYTEAFYALNTETVVPAVSRAARKRQGPATENKLAQLDRCMEILCDQPENTLRKLNCRLDRNLMNRLANFTLLG